MEGLRPVSGVPVDTDLVAGPVAEIPREPPPGELVTVNPEGGRPLLHAIGTTEDGYLLRFFGQCDVHVAKDASLCVYRPSPSLPDGLLNAVLIGTTLAFVQSLRGAPVFHASAVEVNGRSLVFVGHSGMGKSSLTAAAAGAGAGLVTEDVLALDVSEHPSCLAGNTVVRLRKKSVPLLDRIPGVRRTEAPDGRVAAELPSSLDEAVPIGAIVIPRPSRQATVLTVTDLPQTASLFRLMNFPRVSGLVLPASVRQQFDAAGKLARSVRVLHVTVPWPPLQQELGHALVALLRDDERG